MRLINCVIVIGTRRRRAAFTRRYYLPTRSGRMRGCEEGAVVSRRARSQQEVGVGGGGEAPLPPLTTTATPPQSKGQVLHPDREEERERDRESECSRPHLHTHRPNYFLYSWKAERLRSGTVKLVLWNATSWRGQNSFKRHPILVPILFCYELTCHFKQVCHSQQLQSWNANLKYHWVDCRAVNPLLCGPEQKIFLVLFFDVSAAGYIAVP